MNENEVTVEELSFWDQHRFLLLIAISIGIAFVMTFISMAMYTSSGTAQLDLSRPGYRGVSSQVNRDDSSFKNYSSIGPVNQSTINEFKNLFITQATTTKSVDAFSGDPLSPVSLGINDPTKQ